MSWASKIAKPYRIDHEKKFRLKDFDPADTSGVRSRQQAQELLEKGIAEMEEFWQFMKKTRATLTPGSFETP